MSHYSTYQFLKHTYVIWIYVWYIFEGSIFIMANDCLLKLQNCTQFWLMIHTLKTSEEHEMRSSTVSFKSLKAVRFFFFFN